MKRPWSKRQRAILRREYPRRKTSAVARLTGHSVAAVYNQAFILGLKKSAKYLASPAACRLRRGDNVGVAFQFKAGHQTWNKGIPFESGGRSAETRFKKGRRPDEAANYQPIGTLRTCTDGLLERKVTDNQNVAPARRWVAVHRLAWIRANGPIPPGHTVVFKPGRRTTVLKHITADAVELVSRAELMRRNSHHTRYPKEISRLIQLRGAVQRQINRRASLEKSY